MKNLSLVRYSLLTALICVFSCVAVPIGYIPVTLSIPAILISSKIAGIKGCIFPVVSYILLGLFGLPVFSGFGAGAGVLFGPRGGFIWSYLPMAVLFAIPVGFPGRYMRYIFRFLLDFSALLVCYFFGSVQYANVAEMHIREALAICVYPFVLVDIIKIIVSRNLSDVIFRRLRQGNLI